MLHFATFRRNCVIPSPPNIGPTGGKRKKRCPLQNNASNGTVRRLKQRIESETANRVAFRTNWIDPIAGYAGGRAMSGRRGCDGETARRFDRIGSALPPRAQRTAVTSGIRSPAVFTLDRVVNLLSMDRNGLRGVDAQTDFVTPNVDDGHDDIIANHDAFISVAGKDEHGISLSFDADSILGRVGAAAASIKRRGVNPIKVPRDTFRIVRHRGHH